MFVCIFYDLITFMIIMKTMLHFFSPQFLNINKIFLDKKIKSQLNFT